MLDEAMQEMTFLKERDQKGSALPSFKYRKAIEKWNVDVEHIK